MKRKRTDLSSSGSSSGSDETAVKDDRLSGGVEKSEAASEGVLKQERRGGRGGGRGRGRRGRGGGRGRRGRGGRGGGGERKGREREDRRGKGGRGSKRLTSKGRTTRDVELSASSSSSDGEFDSIVKSLEEEDLKLLGESDDSADHEKAGREDFTWRATTKGKRESAAAEKRRKL